MHLKLTLKTMEKCGIKSIQSQREKMYLTAWRLSGNEEKRKWGKKLPTKVILEQMDGSKRE